MYPTLSSNQILEKSLPKWRQDLDNLQTQATKLQALNQTSVGDVLGSSISRVKELIKHSEDTIDRILAAIQKSNK